VTSTKKPKEKLGTKRAGKGDQTGKRAAPKTTKAKSTQSKTAAKKSKVTAGASVKHLKIQVAADPVPSEASGAAVGELDPFEVAKRKMKGSVPAIVEAMVELAKQGSCTHAKTLLEMTGAKRMFDAAGESEDGGAPWAKLVLERLDEAESVARGDAANLQKAVQG
jgi:hypothetical protein